MSQDLPQQPLIPRNADENNSWSSFFRRESHLFFQLIKNTAPFAANRFVVFCSDTAVYTWVASRAGSDFLAKIVIPLAGADAWYWILSILFAKGITIVKDRLRNNDAGVSNYVYAGIILSVILPVITALPAFFIVFEALGLSTDEKWFGYLLTIDIILRNIEMHFRQSGVGTDHRIFGLDGSYISLFTGILKAGVFFGLSSYFVPHYQFIYKFIAFLATRYFASGLKILCDSLFLRHSGRVFLCPEWKNIFADMALILKDGWRMSAQTFVELTVVGSLSIILAASKDHVKLIAFRLAGTLDGLSSLTGAGVRGLQRMIQNVLSEDIGLSNRTFVITLLSSSIPLGMYLISPRTFLSIFTSDIDVLNAGESIVRCYSSGQFFYTLYAFFQSALWVLFKDSGFSMGTSIGAALFFFAVTLPLILTATGDFNVVMGMYVAYTGLGALLLGGRYLNQWASHDETDAENMGLLGLFRSSPPALQITHATPMNDEELILSNEEDLTVLRLA